MCAAGTKPHASRRHDVATATVASLAPGHTGARPRADDRPGSRRAQTRCCASLTTATEMRWTGSATLT
jgi:hypothetical protein